MNKTKTAISLDELSLLCQDDDWLEAFIRDTEQSHMVQAPAYQKKEDILAAMARTKRARQFQLICYSLKVSTAAAASILFLFTTPFFLEQPASPGRASAAESITDKTQDFHLPPPAEAGQKLQSGLWSLSESIYDLSNELFTGR